MEATGEVNGDQVRNENRPNTDSDRYLETRASDSNEDYWKVTCSPEIIILENNDISRCIFD